MIDELDQLRAFRADLAAPPAGAGEVGRERLAREAGRGGRAAREERRHGGRLGGVRRRRPRRAVIALGAAIAAAGAALAIVSGLDEGHVQPAPATAKEALRRLATVAEQSKGPGVPADHQYFYVASEGTELSSAFPTSDPKDAFSYTYTKRREIWLSVGKSGRLTQTQDGELHWLSPQDKANWIRFGSPKMEDTGGPDSTSMDPIGHYFIGDERFTTQQLEDFRPTPRELFDRLRSRVGDRGQSPDGEVFVEIADALREAPQTPALRATLYRALALVPGVRLLGNVHDRLGRAAVGVAFTEHTGMRQELLFDPHTSEVLNEREVVTEHVQGLSAAPGTVVEDIVYTKRAVTDTTQAP
jgi:hypothetical protein